MEEPAALFERSAVQELGLHLLETLRPAVGVEIAPDLARILFGIGRTIPVGTFILLAVIAQEAAHDFERLVPARVRFKHGGVCRRLTDGDAAPIVVVLIHALVLRPPGIEEVGDVGVVLGLIEGKAALLPAVGAGVCRIPIGAQRLTDREQLVRRVGGLPCLEAEFGVLCDKPVQKPFVVDDGIHAVRPGHREIPLAVGVFRIEILVHADVVVLHLFLEGDALARHFGVVDDIRELHDVAVRHELCLQPHIEHQIERVRLRVGKTGAAVVLAVARLQEVVVLHVGAGIFFLHPILFKELLRNGIHPRRAVAQIDAVYLEKVLGILRLAAAGRHQQGRCRKDAPHQHTAQNFYCLFHNFTSCSFENNCRVIP